MALQSLHKHSNIPSLTGPLVDDSLIGVSWECQPTQVYVHNGWKIIVVVIVVAMEDKQNDADTIN